jgi:hypothetical protein
VQTVIQSRVSSAVAGNQFHMAPEVHKGILTGKSDVFSFGMLFSGVVVRALKGTGKPKVLVPSTVYGYLQRYDMKDEAIARLRACGGDALANVLEQCVKKAKARVSSLDVVHMLLEQPIPPTVQAPKVSMEELTKELVSGCHKCVARVP